MFYADLNSKVMQLEAELARRDEIDQKTAVEHQEALRYLKSTHEFEVDEHVAKINSAEARIAEVSTELCAYPANFFFLI